jgi:hypothetical protein
MDAARFVECCRAVLIMFSCRPARRGIHSECAGHRQRFGLRIDAIRRKPLNYFHARVVNDLDFNGTEAAIFPSCNWTVLAAPALLTTSTCWPSGFSRPTW